MKGFYAKRENISFLPLHIERLVFTVLQIVVVLGLVINPSFVSLVFYITKKNVNKTPEK